MMEIDLRLGVNVKGDLIVDLIDFLRVVMFLLVIYYKVL